MAQSLVKSSSLIRIQLQKRIEEQGLSLTKVSADAEEKGRKISISSLSRYFKNSKVNNLSEESIIWLCYRYGIFVTLHIGTLVMSNGRASFHQLHQWRPGFCLCQGWEDHSHPADGIQGRRRTHLDA